MLVDDQPANNDSVDDMSETLTNFSGAGRRGRTAAAAATEGRLQIPKQVRGLYPDMDNIFRLFYIRMLYHSWFYITYLLKCSDRSMEV